MAKDMLNNLWGKTAQRPVMTEYKLCKSYQEFLAISSNSNIEITNFTRYMMNVLKFMLQEMLLLQNVLIMFPLSQQYSLQQMRE